MGLTTPALLIMGAAAIASPIIIHLLNKRKFKRVDWAAMDFLLEADKKNRRRVRLENLLLLFLRCLACLLIGFLLARPIINLGLSTGLLNAESYDRIVVFDDSLSMSVEENSRSSLQDAKEALNEFVGDLVRNSTQDRLTLYLTSDPTRPVFRGEVVNEQSEASIKAKIDEVVHASDTPANLEEALRQVDKGLRSSSRDTINYVVYVISDMRELDWPTDDAAVAEGGIISTLKRLSGDKRALGCYVVDVGRQDDLGNVFVQEVRSTEKALVAGVRSEFEVTVHNAGKQDVNNAKVRFNTQFAEGEESLPLTIDLPPIAAGSSVTQSFNYRFQRDELADEEQTQHVRIRATVEPASASGIDELKTDNTRHFAARVVPGVKTLIVDGDRTGENEQWESFYLTRALAPPGKATSGVSVDVVGESQFENLRLDDYQVIYLCNLYRIPEPGQAVAAPMDPAEAATLEDGVEGVQGEEGEAGAENETEGEDPPAEGEPPAAEEPTEVPPAEPQPTEEETTPTPPIRPEGGLVQRLSRREQLERWVADGGGLVIVLGDQSDATIFNREFYQDGKGLSPVRLEEERGDPEEESWYHFSVASKHPVMEMFVGTDAFSEYVKIFRWWHTIIAEDALKAGKLNVVATLTNTDVSPAVVEQQFGDGRVMVFTTPLTADWSDWPQDYSFVPTVLELNKYMARKTADLANVQVGDALHLPLDLTRYKLMASVNRPDGETGDAEVTPDESNTNDQSRYRVKYDAVDRQGFYDVVLTRTESTGLQNELFAANIDPREGDLARANTDEFTRKLGDAKVKLVSRATLMELGVDEARQELWPYILGLLVLVLCGEQVLGWLFGRKR